MFLSRTAQRVTNSAKSARAYRCAAPARARRRSAQCPPWPGERRAVNTRATAQTARASARANLAGAIQLSFQTARVFVQHAKAALPQLLKKKSNTIHFYRRKNAQIACFRTDENTKVNANALSDSSEACGNTATASKTTSGDD